ncbi:hypothetical protein K1T71_011602 [Dendrolimus kikuchii]|uniref:Uncharacterized protein n=1 Tax=Dendrolimus kikuchii TaxID=765133 RepID=A0ACC1CLK1_9NEOP|nr:hypothetical protein K1T71_011602 [Dendrolimus kikuchii]
MVGKYHLFGIQLSKLLRPKPSKNQLPDLKTLHNAYMTHIVTGVPNDLSVTWHQYPYNLGIVFCKLRALISEAASYGSVLTIVAFSLERYLAICHPLHLYAMAGLRRALKIVAVIWILSLLAAAPFAFYTTVNYHDYPPGSGNDSLESAFCAMLELPSWYLCELSSLLFFILPGVIILCLYVKMGLRIRSTHTSKPGSPGTLDGVNGSVHGEARQAQSKKTIIRMLAAVVVAFFVCWAPFHFQRLFYIYGTQSTHYHTINEYLFYIAGAFYYVSATVNPILYNVMSHRYRIAFRETLCCGKVRRKKSKHREHSSIRETMVNHTSDGALVRIRSQVTRPRDRSHRSSSYHDTSMNEWKNFREPCKMNSVVYTNRNATISTLCNNNDANQMLFIDCKTEDIT